MATNFIDVLNQLDRLEDGLPKHCPSWCAGGPQGHIQALREGCEVEDARIHVAGDLAGRVEIEGILTLWGIWLRQDPGATGYAGGAFIDVAFHLSGERETSWRIDSGAARVLARQLLHLADQADLRD
jgi:hypothetical protein